MRARARAWALRCVSASSAPGHTLTAPPPPRPTPTPPTLPLSLHQPLQYTETLDEDSIFSKTPSPRVLSSNNNNIVVSALPNGRLVGLVNPDTQTSSRAWTTGLNRIFDIVDGQNDTTDSIAVDATVDANDNVYLATLNRNVLVSNGRLFGTKVTTTGSATKATQITWGSSNFNYLSFRANIRFLELFQTSMVMTAAKDGFGSTHQSLAMPLATLGSLGFGHGAGLVSLTNPGSCLTTGQPTPGVIGAPCTSPGCCLKDIVLDSTKMGTFTGSAYADDTGIVSLIAHADAAKGYAMAAFAVDGSSPVPQTWTSNVQFVADTAQTDPLLNPWNKRAYWLGWKGKVQQGDAPLALYCVQTNNGGSVCPGYGDTTAGLGGGNQVDLSTIYPTPA